jgi:hypothetical protein
MSDSNTAAPPTMLLEREDDMLSVDEAMAFFQVVLKTSPPSASQQNP